jgi:1-acyl-sn-glycerol-3-phosphate acyltransferase
MAPGYARPVSLSVTIERLASTTDRLGSPQPARVAGVITDRVASLALRAAGWTFETELPREKKYIVLAVPHTSNWDGLLLLALSKAIRLPIAWMITADWVRGPLGVVLRRLGAVAIDRDRAGDVVGPMIVELGRRDEMVLVIPPEGTRGRAEHWKSGFYRIALGADVPVVPGYLDYGRKRAGFGPPLRMTGDVHADMDRIRAFYEQAAPTALVPGDFGPVRLREEDPLPSA